MVAQDLYVYQKSSNDILETLLDLARLSVRAGSSLPEVRKEVAHHLLEGITGLCAADCGAIFLTTRKNMAQGDKSHFRRLVFHGMSEEETSTLLDVLSLPQENMLASTYQYCWVTCKLALPAQEDTANGQSSLVALVVVGWSRTSAHYCRGAERGCQMLWQIADGVGGVITSLLLADRVYTLETLAQQDAIQEADRLKSELIGTVSHELRSPLTAIKGYADTLKKHERRLPREERQEFLEAIHDASNRLGVVIDRLLEMSQLETGAIHIMPVPVDLRYVVNDAVAMAREVADAKYQAGEYPQPVTFTVEVLDAEGLPVIDEPLAQADVRRIREVLDNLLENALKYSPQGGEIELMIQPVNARRMQYLQRRGLYEQPSQMLHPLIEVTVRDHGVGIPVEHLERIFERFHRVDVSMTREVNGLGLGLSICKRIVEMHDGFIWAESTPGVGSSFHFCLPLA